MRRSVRDLLSWILLVAGAGVCLAAAVVESPASRSGTVAVAIMIMTATTATERDRRPKRLRRMRRGHCPRCDYDLRFKVGSGCPECGWRRAEFGTGQA